MSLFQHTNTIGLEGPTEPSSLSKMRTLLPRLCCNQQQQQHFIMVLQSNAYADTLYALDSDDAANA